MSLSYPLPGRGGSPKADGVGYALAQILQQKIQEIQALYKTGLDYYKALAAQAPPRPSFYDALLIKASAPLSLRRRGVGGEVFEPTPPDGHPSQGGELTLIAEVKKASPSKGVIRTDFDPVALAKHFELQGAAAISVLTDEVFFHGHNDYLTQVVQAVSLPILRKEFILDEIQIYEAKALGASAILLIQAALSKDQAQSLLTCANAIGLDVLVEIHAESEWDIAKTLHGRFCVGVNNRDLTTFEMDMTQARQLYPKIRAHLGPDVPIVAESGYSTSDELAALSQTGFNAVLIGEGLARNPELLDYFVK